MSLDVSDLVPGAVGGAVLAVLGRLIYDWITHPSRERRELDSTFLRRELHELCRHEWQTTLAGIGTRIANLERYVRADLATLADRMDKISLQIRNGYRKDE